MKTRLRIGDKVTYKDGSPLGRIVDRGFTAKNKSFDFGVNLAGIGMPFIAGFNADELIKVNDQDLCNT